MASIRWRRTYTVAMVAFAFGLAPPALAGPPHTPAPPTGCTASNTTAKAQCTFVASGQYAQQALVFGAPVWSVAVLRHGKARALFVDRSSCVGYVSVAEPGYMCGLPVHRGDHVVVTVLSHGVVRAGDDVCAEDPLCSAP